MASSVTVDKTALTERELKQAFEAARRYAKKNRAQSTWRAYENDWRQFDAWSTKLGLQAFPADSETVSMFVASQAADGPNPATLTRRLAAIRLLHLGARRTLFSLLIGRLTLRLNSHLYEGALDPVALLLYFLAGYGLAGVVFGLAGGLLFRLARRVLPRRAARFVGVAGLSGLFLGPLLYYVLLPDVGLGHGLLSGLIFGASRSRMLLTLGSFAVFLTLAGLLLGAVARRASRYSTPGSTQSISNNRLAPSRAVLPLVS